MGRLPSSPGLRLLRMLWAAGALALLASGAAQASGVLRLTRPERRQTCGYVVRHGSPAARRRSTALCARDQRTAPPPAAPRVLTGSPRRVGPASATLGGRLDPRGRATSYRMDVEPASAHGPRGRAVDARVPPGRGSRAVTVRVTGLRPRTTYRYSLVATTCGGCRRGTTRGTVHTFTTAALAAVPSRTAAPRPPLAATPPARPVAPRPPPPAGPTYQNPIGSVFADPMGTWVGRGGAEYYAYATGDGFPVARSSDLVHWADAGRAFAARPAWVVPSGDWHPWAPSALRLLSSCPGTTSPACFVLYYVGLAGSVAPGTNCVGVATATAPAGPFTDRGPLTDPDGTLDASGRPIGCGDDAGYGNIDPAPFVDPDTGAVYLYVSTDRRCDPAAPPSSTCPLAPTISVIPLSVDGLYAAGRRTPLLTGDPGTWEAASVAVPTVEGPWVEKRGGTYDLFYSGGSWRAAYGMGYATASSPTGPFAKTEGSQILHQTSEVLGPGGGSVIAGPHGGDWMLYHARAGDNGQPRTLRIDPLVWGTDGTVAIAGPTTTPQSPVP